MIKHFSTRGKLEMHEPNYKPFKSYDSYLSRNEKKHGKSEVKTTSPATSHKWDIVRL